MLTILGPVLVLSLALNACSSRYSEEQAKQYEACKDAVNDKLLSPSSSRFPDINSEDVMIYAESAVEGIFYVRMYVDAPNAFGVMLREDVRCYIVDLYSETYKILLGSFYESQAVQRMWVEFDSRHPEMKKRTDDIAKRIPQAVIEAFRLRYDTGNYDTDRAASIEDLGRRFLDKRTAYSAVAIFF